MSTDTALIKECVYYFLKANQSK